MPNITDANINSLLADATYALEDLDIVETTGAGLAIKLRSRMTPILANYISDNFEVVTHIDSNEYKDSGFDATVWREKKSGKTYVSMTGSKLVINKIRIMNHKWIAANFTDGEYWGEIFVTYSIDENNNLSYKLVEYFMYPKIN